MNELKDTRKEQVRVAGMFDRISGKYDFLNCIFSAGIDRYWRREAVRSLGLQSGSRILDVATGTAEMALEACRQHPQAQLTGVDISEGMLELGRQKIHRKGLADRIDLLFGAAESLPFKEGFFDAAMVAFGVRNFEDLSQGLREMLRVVRPGGKLVILEFSRPRESWFRKLFDFYFRRVMPWIGRKISSDREAYQYLPDTVLHFPCGTDFLNIMQDCGYERLRARTLTFGLVTLYSGFRPLS